MGLGNDIRFGARTLRKAPGFTATAILTLALGIGATTAIFSVADAMLWKPVPLPHLESLMLVLQRVPGDPSDWNSVPPADVEDIRRASTSFESFASWDDGVANIVGPGGEPERVYQILATADFFQVIGVQPAIGRGFQAGEDQPGREREVVLSDRIWRRRFGADPGIVGRSIRLDDQDYEVTGVMPPKFDFPLAADIWTPLALKPEDRASRRLNMLQSIARLKPGRGVERAQSELDSIAARLEGIYPDTNKGRRYEAMMAHRYLVGDYSRQYVLLLFGAVLFVLLIACVNVANLQFARALGRVREVALRTALGAARWRLISQLVTESVMLALAGAALGLVLANWGINLIRTGMPAEVEHYILGWSDIRLDGRTLIFTMAAAVLAGILAGLAPAWQHSRPDLNEALKEGSRGSSSGRGRRHLRTVLVSSEIGLAVVLLVGAGLMVRGFRAMVAAGAELEPSTLLTLRLGITVDKYKEPRQVAAFYREVLDRIGAIPGVRSGAAAIAMPYCNHSSGRALTIEGRAPQPGEAPSAMYQAVSANFFGTVHVPLRAGRLLNGGDGEDTPRVAVISERLAQRYWPGQPAPLGRRIKASRPDAPPGEWLTIVGVVGSIKYDVWDRAPRAIVYVPYLQAPSRSMDIGIRSTGDPLRLAHAAIAAVRSVDSEEPVSDVRSMDRLIRNNAIGMTYVAILMGVFGVLALALSCIGVYGVMAYLVSEQVHEIGIRMALGASTGSVLGMVFRRGLMATSIGLAGGLVAAYGLARLLASLIYGVSASDPATFVGIPLALIASAALAIAIPARKAARIDPIAALRHE
jgi:putative ABC transport system permease protein